MSHDKRHIAPHIEQRYKLRNHLTALSQ